MVDAVFATACFYWRCLVQAWSGSWSRGNAWQTIPGAIALWIAAELAGYQVIIPDTMPGAIVLALMCTVAAFLPFFIARFIYAPAQLYEMQKRTADVLAERLSPRLRVYLDPRNSGVQTVTTELRTVPPASGPLSKWVQITVESISDVPLSECEARVTRIQRLNDDETTAEELIEEPVFCSWSQAPADERRRINIPPRVTQAANLFSLYDETGQPEISPEFNHVKVKLRQEIQNPGEYRIRVVVFARDAAPVVKSFLFRWEGSFESVRIVDEGAIE